MAGSNDPAIRQHPTVGRPQAQAAASLRFNVRRSSTGPSRRARGASQCAALDAADRPWSINRLTHAPAPYYGPPPPPSNRRPAPKAVRTLGRSGSNRPGGAAAPKTLNQTLDAAAASTHTSLYPPRPPRKPPGPLSTGTAHLLLGPSASRACEGRRCRSGFPCPPRVRRRCEVGAERRLLPLAVCGTRRAAGRTARSRRCCYV